MPCRTLAAQFKSATLHLNFTIEEMLPPVPGIQYICKYERQDDLRAILGAAEFGILF
jgi:hypothetical protein